MAAELAVAALGPVIEVLKLVTKPIIRQFNYLCCFTSNIDSLKDEAKNLDDALAGLEGEVEVARDNVQEPVPQVQAWLTDSKKIKDEISGILDEAENVGSGYSKLRARFSLSKRAKKITDRTKELRGKGNFEVKFQQGPPAARQAVQFGKTFECESRNKIEDNIMTTLRGGNVNMVGICGMGGLGKTTMAKKIRNRVLNEDVFQEVAMVVVSQPVNKSKIQVEIGGSLGLHLENDTSETRVQKLHARLSDTKRSTLLVLDDVWDRLVLEDFGIPRDSKWCTILLTSRNSDVLRAMDVKIFGMEVLSEEEAWSFFRERAGTCVDDRELNPIAKQVAKECGGLPLALEVVGVGLKHQRVAAIWKNALREMEQCVPDTVRFDKEVYNPLKWSYNRLNSKLAQSLFLLCCLFPEDEDIPLEYLTNFCMGLRIFEGIINMEDARNKMRALTEFLKDRSLLLECEWRDCVRMHDVVRDVCTIIAKEKGYIGKVGCTWISSSHLVGERNELLSGSRCPNLNLLFLNGAYDSSGLKFDDAFVEGMSELNVLCIQYYLSLTRLPHLTHSLGKLKTLILYSCEKLKAISIVGELANLEILICRGCNSIKELPLEMKGLNRLKLLDLTLCSNLQSIGRGIISSLVGLEELKMCYSFGEWEADDREERENASINELEALPNLACLEIDIEDPSLAAQNMPLLSKKIVRFKIRSHFQGIPSNFSRALSLFLERETRFGDWIEMQFLRDVEYLRLIGAGANNVDLAKIHQNIRWLELRNCENLKSIVRTSGGSLKSDDATVFPFIEHLKLDNLRELQEICDGQVSSTSFQNLKELELKLLGVLTQIWKSSSVCENNNVPHFTNLSSIVIENCDSLRNLGQLSMAGKDCLPHLQQLSIKECEMMEQVFLWNDDEEAAAENKNSILITKVFPKLKKVELVYLPNLTTLYQGIQATEFPLLQKLKMKECPKIKSIIDGSNNADIDEDGCLHLLCQPQKIAFGSSFKVLEMDHNPFCGHEISSSLFNRLEKLKINKYKGSMSIFTLSVAANLVSLRKLCIQNCGEMIKVIEDDDEQQQRILIFPKLEELYLDGLPELVSFCDSKCEVEFPLLRNVHIKRCRNMKNLSLGLVATPIVETFTTDLTTYVGVGAGENVAFNSLKKLKIRENENPFDHHKISASLLNGLEELEFEQCTSSMSIFTLSVAANLVSLRKLCIQNCDEMIKVIEDEQQQERILVFPKLEILKFESIPKLVSFCDWKCDVKLPSLRKVEIRKCPNMENFSMGCVSAPNLEAFTTDLMTYIGVGVGVGVGVAFDSLKELEIRDNVNPFVDRKISVSLFNGLEKLEFYRYMGGSMSLFSSSAVGNLVGLRMLQIIACDDIVKVIEDEEEKEDGKMVVSGGEIRSTVVFPKLEVLGLFRLPSLVRFCEWKCEVELPSLTEVNIYECPSMESFSMGFVAAPSLKTVQIDEEEIEATKDLNVAVQQHYLARQQKEEEQRSRRRMPENDQITIDSNTYVARQQNLLSVEFAM